MKLIRDTNGKFRRPTDEERWPNRAEREHMQRVRAIFNAQHRHTAEFLRLACDNLKVIDRINRRHA